MVYFVSELGDEVAGGFNCVFCLGHRQALFACGFLWTQTSAVLQYKAWHYQINANTTFNYVQSADCLGIAIYCLGKASRVFLTAFQVLSLSGVIFLFLYVNRSFYSMQIKICWFFHSHMIWSQENNS